MISRLRLLRNIGAFDSVADGARSQLMTGPALGDHRCATRGSLRAGHTPPSAPAGPARSDSGLYVAYVPQSPDESWQECRLHAHHLMGDAGCGQLLAESQAKHPVPAAAQSSASAQLDAAGLSGQRSPFQ